jgi:branched-chain amino acid transport system permease protein
VKWIAVGALAAGTLALPLVLDESQTSIYVLAGLAMIVTIGISLLMGYAGQVSLGQAAFYAIGGYTAGLLAVHGWPRPLGLLAAPVVAAGAALAIAAPLLRLRGLYLAFATLAVQLIVLSLAGKLALTGGDIGLRGIPQLGVGSSEVDSVTGYAYLTWVAVALVLLVTVNVIRSRPGRGLRALATSEVAAGSAGVPVGRYRLVVFAISAGYAGLAGGIYAYFVGYVAPGSFPVVLSFEYIVMAVVGGIGSVWGAVAGVALITLAVQVLNRLGTEPGMPSFAPSVFSYAVYALLLVAVLLFLPRGLVTSIGEAVRRRGRMTT